MAPDLERPADRWRGWAEAAALLVASATLFAFVSRIPSWNPADLVHYAWLFAISLVIHEGGHAIVSLLVRHRLVEVQLGAGPHVTIRLRGTRLRLAPVPLGGHVLAVSNDPDSYRTKRILIIIAGFTANAVVFLAIVAGGAQTGLLWELAMVNALDAAINVLPLRIKTPLGPVRSDGGLLVATLTASPAELEEEQASFYAVQAQILAEGGDRDAARDVVLGALHDHPTSQILRGWHGHDLVLSRRYDDAADVFRALADPPSDGEVPMQAHIRALYLNNLAWSDLMTEDERLLPEAEDASRRAIEVLPAHPAVMGTRAFALICGGNLREGTQLGEKVFAKHRDTKDRATTAAVVAIGRALDWRIPDAERWLATARGLDADCDLLERASQELERRKAGPNLTADLEGTWSSDQGRVAESG
jgi:hypothetical protein